jgi:hypothetical protein
MTEGGRWKVNAGLSPGRAGWFSRGREPTGAGCSARRALKGRHELVKSGVAPLGLKIRAAMGFRGLTPTAKRWRRFAAELLGVGNWDMGVEEQ